MSKSIEMRFTISVDDDTTDEAVDDLMADVVDFVVERPFVLESENDEWEEM